jgi:hypothetical protein
VGYDDSNHGFRETAMNSDDQATQCNPPLMSREEMGPFLLLGVDKDAAAETIEAHWAQRVIWSRKNQLAVGLADINWAREVLSDFSQRVRADVTSLNPDTGRQSLRQLALRYGVAEPPGPTWEPIDIERPPADLAAGVDVPDAEAIRRSIAPPEVPWETPAAMSILDAYVKEPLDPWNLPFSEEQPG